MTRGGKQAAVDGAEKRGAQGYAAEGIAPWRLALDRACRAAAGQTVRWVVRHWLLLANLSNAATVAGAALSPYLMAQGWPAVGGAIFAAYSLICAQNPAHSYFVRGYQMALDQRMFAIYAAATLAGMAYALLRQHLRGGAPALSWRAYLLLSAPMALDGFTQLFGWRHSTWELRTATGALFGVASVWWLYPFLEREIRRLRVGLERRTEQGWTG